MKQFHETAQLPEELLRRIIASSPDCLKLLDLEGNLVAMSEGGRELLEIVDLTPHLGSCWTEWWQGDFRQAALAAVAEAREGRTGRFEASAKTFGGTPKWWEVTISPVFGPDGKPETLLSVSRDVTTKVQAERQLADARAENHAVAEAERARLADVFNRSPSFMTVFRGPRHVFERANERYLQLVGQREILGKPLLEALPELAGQGFDTLLDRVYTTGEPFVGKNLRVMIQRTPGGGLEERFLDVVYQATRDADGTISGVLTHGVDVTERATSEAALAQLAEQRRLALDSAQMGWWQLDLSSGQVYWDERFKEIFGAKGEEMAYDKALKMIHPEDVAGVEEAVKAALRPDDPVPYATEYRVVHDDGAVRWVRSQGKAHLAGEGAARRAVSLVGTVVDTTETKVAQDAIKEREARFRQLADTMPQIVWTARPDGGLDYVNARWYEYIDKTEAESAPADWHVRVHPDDLAGAAATWARSVETGEQYETSFRVRGADESYRWFLVRARAIREADGGIGHWYGTCTDIQEQRALHEENAQLLVSERAARSEAERTSQMKDEFLATLSHELRTPLNAILGWAQVLREGSTGPEDLAQGLATIERNARAQTQIIEDLLDMSKIISGKVRLDVQRIDLKPALEAAIETMRPAAAAKHIRLQAVLDPLARPVSGDPNRLQQVFWNLLSNAIKFTPRGGRVQVVLERVNSHLEVSVIDTGEGIRAEFLPYVFDRFRQADASTTRQHGGLGLGLAIVKQLVELHGGSVRVRSGGPGTGTTFVVHLPLTILHPDPEPGDEERRHPQAGASPVPLLAESLNLTGLKVLVVDDEADARALLKRLLEDRGANVATAGSVEEAVRLFEGQKPDVLVSDIGMPGEDGYALIRRVRALGAEKGGNVPAVALTAYTRAEDRVKAVRAGFQMHVAKPVEPAELLTMVASLGGRVEGGRMKEEG